MLKMERIALFGGVVALLAANAAVAQNSGPSSPWRSVAHVSQQPRGAVRRASAVEPEPRPAQAQPQQGQPQQGQPQQGQPQRPKEHPIMPALRWAYAGVKRVEAINDYSCNFVKRERVDGVLADTQYIFMKVRHRPFSVYLYFQGPDSMKGQEAIYVEGQNNGKLLAHGTGLKAIFGTIALDPSSTLAMSGNRYPITKVGLLNLLRELIVVGESDRRYGECEVQMYRGAKVGDRGCTCVQFVHPVPRREFRYHVARIFVDDELNLPIRYEAYDWPRVRGGKPTLTEEYSFLNLSLNNGFTNRDFDTRNPQYGF